MIPTGPRDPFALRRAAQGVVKILAKGTADAGPELLGGDLKLEDSFSTHPLLLQDVRIFLTTNSRRARVGLGRSGRCRRGLVAIHDVRPSEISIR